MKNQNISVTFNKSQWCVICSCLIRECAKNTVFWLDDGDCSESMLEYCNDFKRNVFYLCDLVNFPAFGYYDDCVKKERNLIDHV